MDYYKFFSCLGIEKMSTYYQRNKERLLEQAKQYYENNKERLKEQGRNRYREVSNKEKKYKENMEEIDIKKCLKKANNN